jgi:hypothetical protein
MHSLIPLLFQLLAPLSQAGDHLFWGDLALSRSRRTSLEQLSFAAFAYDPLGGTDPWHIVYHRVEMSNQPGVFSVFHSYGITDDRGISKTVLFGSHKVPRDILTSRLDHTCRPDVDCHYLQWSALAPLVGIWAEENTRESLFTALQRGDYITSTGPRFELRFSRVDFENFCHHPSEQWAKNSAPKNPTFAATIRQLPDTNPRLEIVKVQIIGGLIVERSYRALASQTCFEIVDKEYDPKNTGYYFARAEDETGLVRSTPIWVQSPPHTEVTQ